MNKKMSYNVNAIVGKYIMPVTFHNEYSNVWDNLVTSVRVYSIDVIDDKKFQKIMCYLSGMHRKDRELPRCGYCCLDYHSLSIDWVYDHIKLQKYTRKRYYKLTGRDLRHNKVVDLLNELLDRYKPTSKYYMAFARISEYFY
jgi:hypothetical protein